MEKANINNVRENKDEIILYEEQEKEEERIEQSESELEVISDEEFMLECARFGDYEELKNLFEENKTIDINYTDNRQNTALRMNKYFIIFLIDMASANGHLDIIKLIVDTNKSNLNLKNYAGNTPLHWAAVNGLKDVVTYLFEKGADITIKNNQNKVAAEEAYEKQYFDIAEFLVDKELIMNKDKNITEENVEMENELAEEIENEIKEEMDRVNLNK